MTKTNNYDVTLNDVHNVFKKNLYLSDTDFIDTILATAISYKLELDPVWIIFVGSSGDGKSTHLKTLTGLEYVKILDQITKSTFATGLKGAKDLGEKLQNNDTILVIPDMASITSDSKENKRKIFANFRTLYDGDIYKDTGSDAPKKECQNCHVTIIGGATHRLQKEYIQLQSVGTRELMYSTKADPKDNRFKQEKAYDNVENKKEIVEELKDIIHRFLKEHKPQDIEISDTIRNFIINEAERLANLRVLPDWNRYNDEIEDDIHPEVPTRTTIQLKKLYRCLMSLDDDYSEERAKSIISHVVESSGESNRARIYKILSKNINKEYTIRGLSSITRLSRRTIKRQLETLWALKLIEKEVRYESISTTGLGRYEYISYYVCRKKMSW